MRRSAGGSTTPSIPHSRSPGERRDEPICEEHAPQDVEVAGLNELGQVGLLGLRGNEAGGSGGKNDCKKKRGGVRGGGGRFGWRDKAEADDALGDGSTRLKGRPTPILS